MRLSAIALIALLGATTPGHAADLVSVYEAARESDPVFQQAVADLNARQELLPQARAAVRPSVSADAAYDRVDQQSDFDNGLSEDGTYNQLSYGVELTQPLYDARAFSGVDVAEARVAGAEADFRAAEQTLFSRVAERYFAVLDARVALRAAQAEVKAIERQLEQAKQRFEVGVIARTDVEEAQARADLARAAMLEAEDALASARERLRVVTGVMPDTLEVVRPEVTLQPPEPVSEALWRERAEEQNPSLQAARYAAQAAMDSVDVARGERYPSVDARARYGYTDSGGGENGGLERDQLVLGVQVSVPLYLGGGIGSRVREAQYRYTEARARLEEVRRDVGRSTADALRGVIIALQRVRALDQARQSTRAALEATEAGFEVGTRTIVDVLDAQQELFRAIRDYEQARHSYLLNTLRLREAAGSLDRDALASVNALLVPADSEVEYGMDPGGQ